MRKFFTLTTVASGAALGMIVAGVLALVGGAYDQKVVRDQLVPQKIFFAENAKDLPDSLKGYAGQQVDTGKEAKLFADDYLGMHLEEIAGGKSYAEVSAAFMADQKNEELGAQRQSLFMGETLRGMLLSAWGWGTVGTIATIAGVILIGMGAILLSIPLLAAFSDRRRTAPRTRTSTAATPVA